MGGGTDYEHRTVFIRPHTPNTRCVGWLHPPGAVLQGLLKGAGVWEQLHQPELFVSEGTGMCL